MSLVVLEEKTLLSWYSVFKFKESNSQRKRKSPRKRTIEVEPIEESSESEFEDDFEDDDDIIEIETTNICENCRDQETEIEMLKRRISEMEVENKSLKEEVEHLRAKKANIERRIFSYNNISADPKLFRKIARFEREEFVVLLDFLNPGNNNEK